MQGCQVHHRLHTEEAAPPHAGTTVHHLHPPAGGGKKTRVHRVADHDGGTETLRERLHHIHAYRLRKPLAALHRHGEGSRHGTLRREVQQATQLYHPLQGRTGGARGNTPCIHGQAGDRRHQSGAPTLRPHLETHSSNTDGRCRTGEDHRQHQHRRHHGAVRRNGRGSHLRRLPQGIPRERRRRRRQAERRGGRTHASHDADRRRDRARQHRRDRTLLARPRAIYGSIPRTQARGTRHRTSVNVRPDNIHHTAARIRRQGRQEGRRTVVHHRYPRRKQGDDKDEDRDGGQREGKAAPDRHRHRRKRLPHGELPRCHGLQLHRQRGGEVRLHRRGKGRLARHAQGLLQGLRAYRQQRCQAAQRTQGW